VRRNVEIVVNGESRGAVSLVSFS